MSKWEPGDIIFAVAIGNLALISLILAVAGVVKMFTNG